MRTEKLLKQLVILYCLWRLVLIGQTYCFKLKAISNIKMIEQVQIKQPLLRYAEFLGKSYQQQIRQLLLDGFSLLLDNFRQQIYDVQPIRARILQRIERFCKPDNIDSLRQSGALADELGLFFWLILRAPGIWVQLIQDQQILADDNVMDLYMFISRVYKKLIQAGETTLPGLFSQLSSICQKELFYYLEVVANQISQIFNVNKKLVVEEIDELNSEAKTVKLINKFIVYKLLKQLSTQILAKIKDNLRQNLFRNVQPDLVDTFAGYILRTHDILSMVSSKYGRLKASKKTLQDQFREKVLLLSSHMKHVSYREALRQDGKKAVYIEFEEEETEPGKPGKPNAYMAQIDCNGNIVFNNPSLMIKKWRLLDRNQNADIESLVQSRGAVVNTMKGAPHEVKEVNITKSVQTVGGSLGNCLANIDRYDSLQGFVMDFSKKAVVASSLNVLVERLPILGYFLISVGFTYSFYSILSNGVKNGKKKLQDLGNVFIGTGTSIGGGIIGGVVGSAFIPIPFVGLFLGSVVGGFIGGVTSNSFLKFLHSSRLSSLVDCLLADMGESGQVRATPQGLKQLGIKKYSFYDSIPQSLQGRLGCDTQWMTIICFVLTSFEEAKLNKDLSLHQDGKKRISYIVRSLESQMRYMERQRLKIRIYVRNVEDFLGEIFQSI